MTAPMMTPPPRADGFTRSTDVPLYWREDGPPDAPALLLLHGGPGAHHDYLYPQMLALAESHRVITFDQRGGGQSKTDDRAPITWRTMVADVERVIEEFQLDAPIVVGYSWGALLAMLHTIEHGSASSLALISPAPITRTWRDAFEAELLARQRGPVVQQLRTELAQSGLRESDPAAYRQRSFEISVAGYFADPTRAVALTPFRVTGRVQQSVWESLGDFDLREPLAAAARAVPRPVIVVHGREDPIPLPSAAAVAEAFDVQLVVIEDCGHVPYVEQPDALFHTVSRFLSV